MGGSRALDALLIIVALVACGPQPLVTPSSSPAPTATVDIKRSKLDIAYVALVSQDVHNVTSRRALQGAVEALKAEAKRTGGDDTFAALELQDTSDVILADFRKFADATAEFARRNPQIRPDRLADVAIDGMIKQTPDCHTRYHSATGGFFASRPAPSTGSGARVPSGGTSLGGPDEAGLTGKLLPGGIAYVTFAEFRVTGTYRITDQTLALLDRAVAAGARAWLFDLRGNVGGFGADEMASWFLNAEKTLDLYVKTGLAGTSRAFPQLRLPESHQLPIAIVVNDRGGSAPEHFAAWLRETKRATLVGQQTVGCLGAATQTRMSDGSQIDVTVQEVVGAVTGTKYNNVGIVPDVQASDPTAVDRAIEILRAKV